MSFPGSIVIASLAPLGGAMLLAACNAKVLPSDQSNAQAQAQAVAPSDVTGTMTSCGANAAHPNVCCTAGAGEEASCVTNPDAPFAPCAIGETTYPDPRSCCPLDGAGTCTSAPPPSSSAPVGVSYGPSGCSQACPPGFYIQADAGNFACCATSSDGHVTECFGGGPSSAARSCPPCPSGWQVPEGVPDLCCTTHPDGIIACFSQADVPFGAEIDAGAPSATACSGTGGPDGAAGPCGCQEQIGSETYAVSCDPATNLCTCSRNNAAPASTFPDDGNTCFDASALFAACGFPSN
jgi:hypothetical protein